MTPTNTCTYVCLGQNWSNLRSYWANSALRIAWAKIPRKPEIPAAVAVAVTVRLRR
jgi:hypothetical protein